MKVKGAITMWYRLGRTVFVRSYRPEFERSHGGAGEELAAARVEGTRVEGEGRVWLWFAWDVPGETCRTGRIAWDGRGLGGLQEAKRSADAALARVLGVAPTQEGASCS